MKPILTLKPIFIGWVVLVSQIPLQLFLMVWSTLFLGGITFMITRAIPGQPLWPVAIFILVPLFGMPLGSYLRAKYGYAKTVYNIFEDRIELQIGSLTNTLSHTIKFDSVGIVDVRKTWLQNMYNLGTIYIGMKNVALLYGAAGEQAFGATTTLKNIQNPDAVCNKIKELVSAAQSQQKPNI